MNKKNSLAHKFTQQILTFRLQIKTPPEHIVFLVLKTQENQ